MSNDDVYANLLSDWESVQPHYNRAIEAQYGGMISKCGSDVNESRIAFKQQLIEEGYKFGTYNTDRTLFERLDREVPLAHGPDVFIQLKSILEQINTGAKPKKNRISLLVMDDTQYVKPVADLVLLLSHNSACVDDLTLLWELTDRLWCFGHPVRVSHSGMLYETCEKITSRLSKLVVEGEAVTWSDDDGDTGLPQRGKRRRNLPKKASPEQVKALCTEYTVDEREERWKEARDKRDKRNAAHDELSGCCFSNGGRNHRGEMRKNEDLMIAIAGPHEGLVGLMAPPGGVAKRTATGTYITVTEPYVRKGESVAIDDVDLDFFDDWMENK
jgi:hypothetical protein